MPIQQRPFRLKHDPCAYCGRNTATQSDVPIPRYLYPESLRTQLQFQLLKVPACRACNRAKSRGENALRDFLLIDIDKSDGALAQELFAAKMLTTVTDHHAQVLDELY
ncbi:MAG: hypothetical protein M3Q03_21100 [Chloroflexota bacterium]|nr:hypothetical protein [Chloroflexota bacterium]